MAEEIAPKPSRKRRILKIIVIVLGIILVPILLYVGLLYWADAPRFIELDLPSKGLDSAWEYPVRITYSQTWKHNFIWRNIETFSAASSNEIADSLDAWLNENGWQPDSYADKDDFILLDPCEPINSDATDQVCKYYRAKCNCTSYCADMGIATLYVEYIASKSLAVVAVTTINASVLTAIECGL
jgi:hypothetical protein